MLGTLSILRYWIVIEIGRNLSRSQQHKLCLTFLSQGGNSRQKGGQKEKRIQDGVEETGHLTLLPCLTVPILIFTSLLVPLFNDYYFFPSTHFVRMSSMMFS